MAPDRRGRRAPLRRERILALDNVSFEVDALKQNLMALVADLQKARPASAKGVFLQRVSVSSTMGPGVLVDHSTLLRTEEAGA